MVQTRFGGFVFVIRGFFKTVVLIHTKCDMGYRIADEHMSILT